ncbi:MAG: hypothetical protein H6523_12845 [Mycolicibacterium sp.]|nr:hypothetical protein [Mycolicibacterium sp.]
MWKGETRDAAFQQVSADMSVVARQCDTAREAAAIARDASDTRWRLARKVVDAILDAEDDGFHVDEDLTVRDTGFDPDNAAARKTAAAEHADYIDRQVQQYLDAETSTAERLQAKAVELAEPRFEGEGRDATVQLVDNRIKLDPQVPPTPDPGGGGYKPHERFPDHKPNGEWGPKNSGLEGDAAAQEAFNEREKRTHLHIERDQINVRVTDPQTGAVYTRRYDGLEPIPGQPGKYTGLEHKLGDKAPTTNQKEADRLVRSGVPAYGTLRGEPIQVVDAQEIRTPRPPTENGGPSSPSSAGIVADATAPLPDANTSPSGVGGSAEGVARGNEPGLTREQKKHWEDMGPPFSILAPSMPNDPNDPDNHA